jgi:phosphoribosylcarboxyaminoimidazole (NCAIR) mutase
MAEEIRYQLVFGSPSDKKLVLPGILKFSNEYPEIEIKVHHASADNTKEKVRSTMVWLVSQSKSIGDAYLSGAGLSNLLTGTAKTHLSMYDLVVGIPITDSSSEGLTSVVSTGEKPSMNPVLCVSLNNSYAALNIAHKFNSKKLNNVIVLYNHKDDILCNGINELEKSLQEFKINYSIESRPEYVKISDSLILTPFLMQDLEIIKNVDNIMLETKENGIQVAYCNEKICGNIPRYLEFFQQELDCTGFVSSMNHTNAAIMTAVLTRNQEALDIAIKKRGEKILALEKDQGYVIKGGKEL